MVDAHDNQVFDENMGFTRYATIQSLSIDPELKKLSPKHTAEEYEQLESSMLERGILVPILKDEETGIVCDGMTRLEIALKHIERFPFIPTAERRFKSKDEMKLCVLENTLARRQLTDAQKMDIAYKMKPFLKKLAAERQKAGHTLGQKQPKGKVVEQMAKLAGVKPTTMYYFQKIKESDPKRIPEILENTVAVKKVYNEIIIRENAKLPKSTVPKGIYNNIVYDPGWPHNNKIAGGSGNSGAGQKYREESIEEMCNHPIEKMIAKDAILWLWTLPTFHEEALLVVKSLGFEKIKTKIYWDKTKMSMGFNFRNQVEELLVCTRGNVKAFWLTDQTNIIHAKPEGQHSEKPEEIWKIIERAAKKGLPRTKLSNCELNSRKPRKGWVTVGNQIPYDLRFWVSKDLELKGRAEFIYELWDGKTYDEERKFGNELGLEYDREIINLKMKEIYQDAKKKFPELSIIPKLVNAPWKKTNEDVILEL